MSSASAPSSAVTGLVAVERQRARHEAAHRFSSSAIRIRHTGFSEQSLPADMPRLLKKRTAISRPCGGGAARIERKVVCSPGIERGPARWSRSRRGFRRPGVAQGKAQPRRLDLLACDDLALDREHGGAVDRSRLSCGCWRNRWRADSRRRPDRLVERLGPRHQPHDLGAPDHERRSTARRAWR